jgi:signal transduction histidine kinase
VRLRTGLILALSYVLLVAIVSLEVPLALSLRDRVDGEVRSQAEGQADLVAAAAGDLLDPAARGRLDRLVRTAAGDAGGRVLVVDRSGTVLSDSAGADQLGWSYASRPEIATALGGRFRQGTRYSSSLGTELLATAAPVLSDGRTVGAVRITQSVGAVHATVRRITVALVLLGLVVLLLGLGAGLLIARGIARPISRLEQAARRVADGDLEARAPDEGSREQRSLARSFNDMTARLGRLLGVQREFVADASHQLRTPLTGIRLRVEEARAIGVSPEADAQLAAAMGEVDRMARVVDELLVLSRAGEPDAPAEALDLAQVAARCARRLQPLAESTGVALELAPPTGRVRAWAPGHDVERALDALVENALRYAPVGSLVELAARDGGVEVRDRGPGLEPGEEALVWERFHRGSAGRRTPGGTGLGLAIVRELARGWGGEATIAARAGGGALARIEVPAPVAAHLTGSTA